MHKPVELFLQAKSQGSGPAWASQALDRVVDSCEEALRGLALGGRQRTEAATWDGTSGLSARDLLLLSNRPVSEKDF